MVQVLTRKPAPIVKCQHCKWVGSARGLFTHVRMAHPNITEKPPTIKREHPLLSGGVLRTANRVEPHRNSKPHYIVSKKEQETFLTMAGLTLAMVYILQDPKIGEILSSEGVNPKRLLVALGKI